MKSSLASGDLGYPGQQGSREDWLRGFSWELEMREQKDKMLLIKGKYFHKKALQEKKPSQDGELQLEGVWELQESPGSCLTLVQASSCTSPRWSWPCSRVVRMLPAAAGRSAQGSCSTPMHWDRDPPGTHSPRHWWLQQGRVESSLPRCWSCSWVTFTTSICVTFSMVVGARVGCQHPVPGLQNVWKPGKPFLLSPRIFSFPSATPEPLAERVAAQLSSACRTGHPEKWDSCCTEQNLFPTKLRSVIKQCIC